jgi:tetratricopeptide (TPR) repeat protein
VSAGFHAVNAMLLFLALNALTGGLWRSAVVAAIFALHPLRVESVAWIAERKDVLSGFFFFLTLLAYARYAQESEVGLAGARPSKVEDPEKAGVGLAGDRPSKSKYIWYALVMFALGLMSKPMLVTLPFVLLLLDVWPLRRFEITGIGSARNWRKVVLEKIPFFVLSAISAALTMFFQKGAATANAGIALMPRIENAITSYLRYLGKFFWPTKLSILYPHPATAYAAAERWAGWQIVLGVLVLLVISVVCVARLRRRPYLAVGWFWYVGMMVPVIGLVQVGEQAMADRYTYLPLIGLTIALVWWIADLLQGRKSSKVGLAVATGAAVLSCVVLTHRQLSYWQNTVTLFQHAVHVNAQNPPAEFSLGVGLERQGRIEEAMIHYRRALELNPADDQSHYNVGQLLRKQGQWQEAAAEYEAVLHSNPNHVEALLNLAGVLPHLGRAAEATALYEAALRISPESIEGLNNLAWLLAANASAELRNGARAVELAERACQLTRFNQAALVGTLAAAYAEAGRFSDAVAMAEKACALATQEGKQALLEKNGELLELYRAGKPYHDNAEPDGVKRDRPPAKP